LEFADTDFSAIGIPKGWGFQAVPESQIRDLFRAILSGEHPSMGLLPLDVDPKLTRGSTRENNLATYLQARVDLGRLQIVGGARMARVEVNAVNLLMPQIYID